ncbi:MAG TPA: LamG domain-containing protein, partial [Blastocatellia bacterium]|nr:LamG domain-containing protein [Blastocatellia bacterium]
DGEERAFATPPPGFGAMRTTGNRLRIGTFDLDDPATEGGTSFGFPGVLDEIRISSTAHDSTKIANNAFGFDGPTITLVKPRAVQRGSASAVTLHGAGLIGAAVTSSRADVSATVTASSYTRLDLTITPSAAATLGTAQLTIRDPIGQSTTADLVVVDQQPFQNQSGGTETVVLWHLDESPNGTTALVGSGDAVPAVIGGTTSAGSQAAVGRFGGGRRFAQAIADNDSGALAFGGNSFTVECWIKTTPVGRAYALVGKEDTNSQNSDFSLELMPSGALRAQLFNGTLVWQTEMSPWTYDVDDDQWHLVSMVVDRSAGADLLSIYVDGEARASASAPQGFGAMRNTGNRLRIGTFDLDEAPAESGTTFGFPGVIDDVRVVNFARTSPQIRESWTGVPGG